LKDLFLTLHAPASDAKVYADHVVKRHFDDPRLAMNHGDLFNALSGVLTSLKVACTKALLEINDPNLPGHREGDCWDQWIRRLTKIADENGLPSGASKGADKSAKESPFTLMVKALQERVPRDARRHHGGEAATLAAAINRARKPRDK
jgi:hypothetical protein